MTEPLPAVATAADAEAAAAADPRCLHHLVEAVVARDPGRVAVVHGEQVLGYAELDARANRLAHRLVALGVRAPAVGLLLPRSVDFIVAALAVLKAGGHYVPLDADYPQERLRLMLARAGCPIVVGTTALLAALPPAADVQTVALDALDGEALPSSPPAVRCHPDALAYTMFTSGSTGVPKGVMITHRGVVRLVAQPGAARVEPAGVVLHASSISFDASTFEIWGTLANGARLVLAPPGRLSALDIGALLRRHRVSTVLLPTGLFHLMVDERPADFSGLRRVLVGGDVLSAGHAVRFLRAVPGCELVNAYGPTEVTTATTLHRVGADQDGERPVPIGRAMEGTYVRLLDDELRPVPVGTPGQLYAGGPGLARGYLGDPALTADRFVPDPGRAGARIYATGDLAKERPDGTFEFLARMDDQFKKRGFRVEPGEVEAALRADSALRDAVVLADGATAETRRLVAVLQPLPQRAGAGLVEEVRARLRRTVPEYLVPDLWATVEAFPLSANGKVDRRELLRLATDSAAGGGDREDEAGQGPADAEEAELAAIWAEVLKLDRPAGREEDFFDLGGHSLLASKMVIQVRRRLGVVLPLGAVFDHPTVAALAAAVRAARTAAAVD